MYKALLTSGISALTSAATPADALTLLNLIDAPGQFSTPYLLSFTAMSTSTTLSIAGYQVPGAEVARQNAVQLGAGPNLLTQTWTYTPAASGAEAEQFFDGSPINGLSFEGLVAGSYDTFSQTFATMIGSTYTYSFRYSTSTMNAPSGFRVDVDANVPGSVPELATWGMMMLGFGSVGYAMRRGTKISARIRFA